MGCFRHKQGYESRGLVVSVETRSSDLCTPICIFLVYGSNEYPY
jgi:hypothetical protein